MYRYASKNTIEHLSLHDCVCSSLKCIDNTLRLEMEWMEVLASHPDNPYDKAHQSTEGVIILVNPVLIKAEKTAVSPDRKEIIKYAAALDIHDFEILEFETEPDGEKYNLTLFGELHGDPAYDFLYLELLFSESHVLFNELTRISWFEEERFQTAEGS